MPPAVVVLAGIQKEISKSDFLETEKKKKKSTVLLPMMPDLTMIDDRVMMLRVNRLSLKDIKVDLSRKVKKRLQAQSKQLLTISSRSEEKKLGNKIKKSGGGVVGNSRNAHPRDCKGKVKPEVDRTYLPIPTIRRIVKKISIHQGMTRSRSKKYDQLLKCKEDREMRKEEREKIQKPLIHIQRTVELINQRNSSWRKEESKLLFIGALELTPAKNCKGLITPRIFLNPLDPALVEIVKRRQKEKRTEALLQRSRRDLQVEIYKTSQFSGSEKNTRGFIELIDLTSQDETLRPLFVPAELPQICIEIEKIKEEICSCPMIL